MKKLRHVVAPVSSRTERSISFLLPQLRQRRRDVQVGGRDAEDGGDAGAHRGGVDPPAARRTDPPTAHGPVCTGKTSRITRISMCCIFENVEVLPSWLFFPYLKGQFAINVLAFSTISLTLNGPLECPGQALHLGALKTPLHQGAGVMIYVIPRGEMQRDKPRFFDLAVTVRRPQDAIKVVKLQYAREKALHSTSASFRYGQRNVRRKARWARMMMIRAYLRTRFYEARPRPPPATVRRVDGR